MWHKESGQSENFANNREVWVWDKFMERVGKGMQNLVEVEIKNPSITSKVI